MKTLFWFWCAIMGWGCPSSLASPRAKDWECGLLRRSQNNWAEMLVKVRFQMEPSLRCLSHQSHATTIEIATNRSARRAVKGGAQPDAEILHRFVCADGWNNRLVC